METFRLNTRLLTSLSNILFMPSAEIREATNIATTTWYNIMRQPTGITIQQLLSIANGLHVPVRRFFSTDKADIIGRREDYITEPYQLCHYDEAALHEFVQNRATTATWKKAADATGMSYSRLRNSLLAITRTPVTRFLTVCNVFEIDPFAILIDPNPDLLTKKDKRQPTSPNTALRGEIDTLRKDIDTLNDTIANLKEKYEQLLQAHQLLQNHVNAGINGSNIGIAAEPLEDK